MFIGMVGSWENIFVEFIFFDLEVNFYVNVFYEYIKIVWFIIFIIKEIRDLFGNFLFLFSFFIVFMDGLIE